MPKSRPNNESLAFGRRLVSLLATNHIPRRGAGAYLAKKYRVRNVTANGWLNGEYRPETDTAKKIAEDHGSEFNELYFGDSQKYARQSVGAVSLMEEAAEWEHDGVLTREELVDLVREHRAMRASGMFAIPQLDVRASMGPGAALQEHVDIVRNIRVSLSELRRQVPNFTAPENLRILTGLGDSMKPTFSDGDPLLIDIGVSDVTIDGVYVLEKDDQLYVKRMQRKLIDGSLLMISDNKDYGTEEITSIDRQKFAVRGRVLLAWNSRRL